MTENVAIVPNSGIRGDISADLHQARKPVTNALDAPFAATSKLAAIGTRLAAMDVATQDLRARQTATY